MQWSSAPAQANKVLNPVVRVSYICTYIYIYIYIYICIIHSPQALHFCFCRSMNVTQYLNGSFRFTALVEVYCREHASFSIPGEVARAYSMRPSWRVWSGTGALQKSVDSHVEALRP